MFNNIENYRYNKDIYPKYRPRTAKFSNFFTQRTHKIYNLIPNDIKLKSKIQFKKYTKTWILNDFNGVNDTCD